MSRRVGTSQGKRGRLQYTDRSGKSGHVSPVVVEKYLACVNYPTEKKSLLDKARDKDAPEDVIDLLNNLPDKTYKSPIDYNKINGKNRVTG